MAKWLRDDYRSPVAQLATIELLISPIAGSAPFEDGTRNSISVQPATMANVSAAVQRWAERAHSHPDNVAIFYFCGHGVSAGIFNGLLLEDFGDDHSDRTLLKNVLDIDGLHHGMDTCKARKQCFFVDACRNTPAAIAERAGQGGIGQSILDRPIKQGRFGPRFAPIFFACLPSQKAYSRPGAVSLFTEGLIKTLDGAGAVKRSGSWVIKTDTLLYGINEMTRQIATRHELPFQPASGDKSSGYDFHILTEAPTVPVAVGCIPPEANSAARFSLVGRRIQHVRDECLGADWELLCKPGTYDVSAVFKGTKYRDKTLEEEIVVPPCSDFRLDVQP